MLMFDLQCLYKDKEYLITRSCRMFSPLPKIFPIETWE